MHPTFLPSTYLGLRPDSPSPFYFLSNSWRIKIMIVVLKISSRSRLNVLHHVIIDTEKKSVDCDCEAFRFIGRCGHIKFYKVLIWRLMHENPSPEVKKDAR